MIVANTKDQGIINAEISVPLKYFCNIWRALEISFINCKINLIRPQPANFFTAGVNRITTFAITDTKLHVPGVTLSTL